MRKASVALRASFLGVAVLATVGCGEPTRIATLNETTQVKGETVAATLREQLANHGFPSATVSCAKTILVNVGPAVSCSLSGAGAKGTVTFTFRTLDGKIDLSSVKVS
jgi:hypothetical protein